MIPASVRALLTLVACLLAPLALPGSAFALDRSGLGCDERLPAGIVDGPAWQAELQQLVNEHRTTRGLAPVQADARLVRAATWKARYQHRRPDRAGVSQHDDIGLDGRPNRTVQERAETCGYTTGTAQENLALSIDGRSARELMQRWLASPGHRANIERPEWRYMGVGTAQGAELNAYGHPNLWVAQLFGTRPSVEPPTCFPASVRAVWGRRIDVDRWLCRAAGSPVLTGPAPATGTLQGTTFVPARRLGVVRFWMRWPDTGVRQRVDVWVSGPPARAVLRRPSCSRGGRCTVPWLLVRPTVPAADARMFVDRRVGGRWVSSRVVRLPARVRSGSTRLVLARGTWRVLVSIANTRAQAGASTRWVSLRVTR